MIDLLLMFWDQLRMFFCTRTDDLFLHNRFNNTKINSEMAKDQDWFCIGLTLKSFNFLYFFTYFVIMYTLYFDFKNMFNLGLKDAKTIHVYSYEQRYKWVQYILSIDSSS